MGILRDRLNCENSDATIQSNGARVADIDARLRQGEPAPALIASLGIAPADLVAALAWMALGDDESLGPTLARSRPKSPKLERALSEPGLAVLFQRAHHLKRLALAAGLLQIHDFWDPSHEAAQKADDLGEKDYSAYWHAIAHRREPDPGNAAYWFRRVSRHPVLPELAKTAGPVLAVYEDSALSARLLPGGAWHAGAMTDLCTRARPGSPEETIARKLQRLEMWLLLEATFAVI